MKGGCKLVYFCSTPGCYNEGEAHAADICGAEIQLRDLGWNVWKKSQEVELGSGAYAISHYVEYHCPACHEAWCKEHS